MAPSLSQGHSAPNRRAAPPGREGRVDSPRRAAGASVAARVLRTAEASLGPRARRASAASLAALALLATAGGAAAQPPPPSSESTQRAIAQSLFDEARALMSQNAYAEACPKLRESYRLEPASGTLVNLAICHEQEGKLAMAYVEYNETLSRAQREGRRERERFARQRIDALTPKLTILRVQVEAPRESPRVTLDGVELVPAAWGIAIPLDPGEHVLEAAVPDRVRFRQTVQARGVGESQTVRVPAFGVGAAGASGSSGSVFSRAPSAQRTAALVVGGVGLAGLGLGAVAGIVARSRWHEATEACPDRRCSDPNDLRLDGPAKTWADVSTVSFIGGGAALATGALLWFTAPSKRVEPLVGPNTLGLTVR
ncbi:MAG TPA: hypothetical protein VFS00_28750, partial [Polyangiaceae bacterium]|nr:hypothetical protein [Polyangiaceae bacterium]